MSPRYTRISSKDWQRNLLNATVAKSETEAPKQRVVGAMYSKEEADVCLNCTKRKCTGAAACFERQRKNKNEKEL